MAVLTVNLMDDTLKCNNLEEILKYNRLKKKIKSEASVLKWKFLFYIGNCAILFLAMFLISLTAFFHCKWMKYEALLRYTEIPLVLVASIGVAMCICALIGFLAAVKNCYVAIVVYGLALLCMIQIKIFIIIASLIKQSPGREYIIRSFLGAMEIYEEDGAAAKIIDVTQKEFGCCGANGIEDWFGTSLDAVPASCCPLRPPSDTSTCQLADILYVADDNCVDKLQAGPIDALMILQAISGLIIAVEIISLLLAVKLSRFLREWLNADRKSTNIM